MHLQINLLRYFNNIVTTQELIPEFYDVTKKGGFLQNHLKINFGTKHDGTPVNNVQLPPWAKNSPEHFVKKFREALESDYVSNNLNHWIDLIFGYKQKGKEAIKANNCELNQFVEMMNGILCFFLFPVFYHLCYEGSVDLDKINDFRARHALEVQISEFGQIPKQLFNKPHVPKSRSPRHSQLSSNSIILSGQLSGWWS